MTKVNLNEELMNQIRLINYDRSKTLFEQAFIDSQIEDRAMDTDYQRSELIKRQENLAKKAKREKYEKQIRYDCSQLLKTFKNSNNSNEKIAASVFDVIKYNIESNGTEEQDILDALKKIKNNEIYSNLVKLFFSCYPENMSPFGGGILSALQSLEFSRGSSYSSTLRNSPIGLGQMVQYEYNDYWLKEYKKILSKYNQNETYEEENPFISDTETKVVFKTMFPPFMRESLHLILPLVSFALMFVPGGQIGVWVLRVAGAVLEGADASIYMWADEDPYMAGLTLLFAFLPLAGDVIAPYLIKKIQKWGVSILKKLKSGNPRFTKEEIELLSDITTNVEKYNKIAKQAMVEAWIKDVNKTYFKNMDFNTLNNFIKYMSKAGKGLDKLGSMAVQIGGTIYSWDWIASKIGLECKNTFPVSKLISLLDEGIGKKLESLQPYTKTKEDCDIIEQKQLLTEYNKIKERVFKNITKSVFEMLLKDNITLKKNNTFDLYVICLQNFLKTAKLDEKTQYGSIVSISNNTFTIKNNLDYVNAKIVTITGQVLKDINLKDKINYSEKFDSKGNKVFIVYLFDNVKNKRIVKIFDSKDYNVSSAGANIKWGYFDGITENMVKLYQKNNGLVSDGIVGRDTTKYILSDINSKKYGEIKNFSGRDLQKEFEKDKKIIDNVKTETIKRHQETVAEVQNKPVDDLINKVEDPKVRDQYVNAIADTAKTYTEDEIKRLNDDMEKFRKEFLSKKEKIK